MPVNMLKLIKRLRRAKEGREEEEKESAEIDNGKIVIQGDSDISGPQSEESEEEEDILDHTDTEKIGLHPEKRDTDWIEDAKKKEEDKEEEKRIERKYPLIPNDPKDDEKVFAWAHITYDEEQDSVIYKVIEPELSEENKEILETIEDMLKERLDIDFEQLKKEEAKNYMQRKVRELLEEREFNLSDEDKDIIEYYAYRNFVGLGRIEPLMNDKQIEDISCDGIDIPVYIYHRDTEIGSVQSNVKFESADEMDSFVRKLAQRCGRSISMAEPLLDGSLPDGSRVQATLETDIARRGTNFTIRRFTEEPLTPIHLLEYGTISPKMMAYLWMGVENGKSLLISGATASGKTTMLNSLSLFIRPELKIVSIEDTPELRLPHPNWVPEVSREGFGFGEHQTGEVTMDDLLKESLRQRPDYIIVGEVRGEEAYILFQQIATGHPGMSTIHASSLQKVMDRLTTKPIELPPSLIENLDLIVFMKRSRRRGKYLRRVDNIYEFEGYSKEDDKPLVNRIFTWDASDDKFENPNESYILHKISEEHGTTPREVQEELLRREKILKWMLKNDIKHYKEVARIISNYYDRPEEVMKKVEEREGVL